MHLTLRAGLGLTAVYLIATNAGGQPIGKIRMKLFDSAPTANGIQGVVESARFQENLPDINVLVDRLDGLV